jgi:hypothetical protein
MANSLPTEIKDLKSEEVATETLGLVLGVLTLYLAYRRYKLKKKLAA